MIKMNNKEYLHKLFIFFNNLKQFRKCIPDSNSSIAAYTDSYILGLEVEIDKYRKKVQREDIEYLSLLYTVFDFER